MKNSRILAALLGLALVIAAFAGCSAGNGGTTESTAPTSESNATESQEPSVELDVIMQDIIDNATSKLQYIKDMTLLVTEIKDDAKEYYFGSTDIEMAEGLALEPEISSPFSVCLVKVPEGVDAKSVRDQIKETVNPMKWVCMGVDPSKVIVEVEGDIVILIMTDNGGPEIYEAFKASVG